MASVEGRRAITPEEDCYGGDWAGALVGDSLYEAPVGLVSGADKEAEVEAWLLLADMGVEAWLAQPVDMGPVDILADAQHSHTFHGSTELQMGTCGNTCHSACGSC